jgi:hypothetical protein
MDFLSKLLQGISFVPSVVNGIGPICQSIRGREEKRGDVVCIRGSPTDRRRDFPSHC